MLLPSSRGLCASWSSWPAGARPSQQERNRLQPLADSSSRRCWLLTLDRPVHSSSVAPSHPLNSSAWSHINWSLTSMNARCPGSAGLTNGASASQDDDVKMGITNLQARAKAEHCCKRVGIQGAVGNVQALQVRQRHLGQPHKYW